MDMVKFNEVWIKHSFELQVSFGLVYDSISNCRYCTVYSKTFGIQRCNSLLQSNVERLDRSLCGVRNGEHSNYATGLATKRFSHERLVSSHQGVVYYHTLPYLCPNPSKYSSLWRERHYWNAFHDPWNPFFTAILFFRQPTFVISLIASSFRRQLRFKALQDSKGWFLFEDRPWYLGFGWLLAPHFLDNKCINGYQWCGIYMYLLCI